MTTNIVPKILVAREAGVTFGSLLTSEFIELNNYKYIDFVIASGAGTAGNTAISIQGKKGADGTAKSVAFRFKNTDGTFSPVPISKSVSVGGEAGNCGYAVVRVTADDLAEDELDRVAIKTSAISNSTVPGCIIAVCYEPRYSE
jgi:hypothetical protein